MLVRWIFSLLAVELLCNDGDAFEWDQAIRSIKRRPRFRNLMDHVKLILPGTKWCGKGNTAANYNDLGTYQYTDSCCRRHDSCPDIMKSGESKHGLRNPAIFSRLHCNCDDELLHCLRNSTDNKSVSDMVGIVYFDLLRQKCYKLEHKITGCKEYNWVFMRCEKYWIDPNSPKSWQWFDVPFFTGGKTIETATI